MNSRLAELRRAHLSRLWPPAGTGTIAALLLVFVPAVVLLVLPERPNSTPLGSILTEDGTRLIVLIADNPATRAKGLSGVASIPQDGLVLAWPAPGTHPIWMADMRFPLDLAWLDEHGRVLAIEQNVAPCRSESACDLFGLSVKNAKMVVELAAGRTSQLAVEVGDTLDIQMPDRHRTNP